jgi:hypothetical protein
MLIAAGGFRPHSYTLMLMLFFHHLTGSRLIVPTVCLYHLTFSFPRRSMLLWSTQLGNRRPL